jgi:cytochrome c oxidase subunit 3
MRDQRAPGMDGSHLRLAGSHRKSTAFETRSLRGSLVSVAPNILVSRWAARQDLRKVQIGMLVMVALGIAPLILRFYEFPAMHVRWDSNAYGSIVWTLLGLHLTHLVTDLGDTIVLAVIMFTKHGSNKRRFGDVQDNALYWNFVVLAWLPIYACIYWIPRL